MIPGHEFINYALTPKLHKVLVSIYGRNQWTTHFWEAKEAKDSMISLLKMAVGPREWSPRNGKLSFPVIAQFEMGEGLRISFINEDGTMLDWDIGTVSQSGVVAVLPPP